MNKIMSIRSVLAAFFSVIVSLGPIGFVYIQAEREKRAKSLRAMVRFEDRMSRLGDHPLLCIEFLKSVPDEALKKLMSPLKKEIPLELSDEQKLYLSDCLLGLGHSFTDKPGFLEARVLSTLYSFTIDFLNLHEDLVAFRKIEVGDSDLLDDYIEKNVYTSEFLIETVDMVCKKTKRNLQNNYEFIEGINEHRKKDEKICSL